MMIYICLNDFYPFSLLSPQKTDLFSPRNERSKKEVRPTILVCDYTESSLGNFRPTLYSSRSFRTRTTHRVARHGEWADEEVTHTNKMTTVGVRALLYSRGTRFPLAVKIKAAGM
jgi:hypothetical protein